jgi:hypothetical protein
MRTSSTFHPKIYWFQGERHDHLIVGSPNMTSGGLRTNVEAAALFVLNRNSAKGRAFHNELEADWVSIVAECDNGTWAQLDEPTPDVLRKLEDFNRRARKLERQLAKVPNARRRRRGPESKIQEAAERPGAKRLVMDITSEQGRSRNAQVQPPSDVWTGYFGIRVPLKPGTSRFLRLRDLRTQDRTRRKVVQHTIVTTVELSGARAGDIVEFVKTASDEYVYRLYKPLDSRYGELDRLLTEQGIRTRGKRRFWFPRATKKVTGTSRKGVGGT